MENIQELRAKKEGIITVKGLLDMVGADADNTDILICIALNKQHEIVVYETTSDSAMKKLGIIEAGKQAYLDGLYHTF